MTGTVQLGQHLYQVALQFLQSVQDVNPKNLYRFFTCRMFQFKWLFYLTVVFFVYFVLNFLMNWSGEGGSFLKMIYLYYMKLFGLISIFEGIIKDQKLQTPE